MNHIPTPDFTSILCLGVAGNFAGHLEQAGETPDFVQIKTQSATAPKGLFPYYVPNHPAQLGQNPLSSTHIKYPEELADNAHLQAEPEVCVLFDVTYQNNLVTTLTPVAFAAFNDCSIRKPGAKKISEKKNWSKQTKGVAEQFIPLSHFEQGGELDPFHIASFLKRDNQFHAYGNDSSVLTYSYFYHTLTDWIIEQLNTQRDFGPLENLQEHIKTAKHPKQMIVLSNNGWFTPSIEPTLQKLLLIYYNKKYDTTIYHSVNMSPSFVIQKGKVLEIESRSSQ
ncbi:MAG: DUF5718 family protein [Thiomicrorhabdus sp.]|nr:DUF5718 family protein [Thiomicrorhabdus sp.]